jgi:hypothetical protein
MTEPTDYSQHGSEAVRQLLRDRGAVVAARGREAGFYRHGPTLGTAREHVLREPLEDILPERYGVTSGEVRASDGSVSGQWDVLIYNRLDTPRMYLSAGAAVLPIEGVLAAISVKSKLGKSEIEEAADAAARLRAMPRSSLPTKPRSLGLTPAVFAFGFRGVALEILCRHVLDATHGPQSPRCLTAACVLEKGLVLPVNAAGNVAVHDIKGYGKARAREGAWGLFVAMLFDALVYQPYAAPNLRSHIGIGELLDEEWRKPEATPPQD